MPKQTVVQDKPVIAQGAVLELSTDDGSTYTQIPGLESVPKIGVDGEFVDSTDISERTKKFGVGIKTPGDFLLAFRRIGSSTVQDALIDAAVAEQEVKFRCTYWSGDIADVSVLLNAYHAEEAAQGNAFQLFAVNGQQSGDVTFSKVA